MVRILLALVVVALFAADASAFGRRNRQCNQCNVAPSVTYTPCTTGCQPYTVVNHGPNVVRQVFGGCTTGSCPNTAGSTYIVPSSGPIIVPAPNK